MKKKCIFCAFFKNMWEDIIKDFRIADWKTFFGQFLIAIGIVVFLIGVVILWSYYGEIIKNILGYILWGMGILIVAFIIGLDFYIFYKWLKKIYIKSKAECE
jgi:cytochrome c biogenesis protein CcdA